MTISQVATSQICNFPIFAFKDYWIIDQTWLNPKRRNLILQGGIINSGNMKYYNQAIVLRKLVSVTFVLLVLEKVSFPWVLLRISESVTSQELSWDIWKEIYGKLSSQNYCTPHKPEKSICCSCLTFQWFYWHSWMRTELAMFMYTSTGIRP